MILFSENDKNKSHKCDLEFVIVPNLKIRTFKQLSAYRHVIQYDFLMKNYHLYDRVILNDLFDMEYCGDPFSSDIDDYKYLYFSEENQRIIDCKTNHKWAEDANRLWNTNRE